jgi:hypothetical protein
VGFVILIVKPGPTVPASFGAAADTGNATMAATVAATRTAVLRFLMILLVVSDSQEGSDGRLAPG